MTTYTRPVCRGSLVLGTACGHCERCEEERKSFVAGLAASRIERFEHVTVESMQRRLDTLLRIQNSWKGDLDYQKTLDTEIYSLRVAMAIAGA